MRYLLSDPALTTRSPGEEFARVVAGSRGADVRVDLAVSLPTTFPLAAHRPRYTVRHLLKTATVTEEPVSVVSEAVGALESSGDRYAGTPEAHFSPSLTKAGLTTVRATVPAPAGLPDDPALLAAFVDHRVVVRLCTVENEALLHGSADHEVTGLLQLPGLRRQKADRAEPLDLIVTDSAAQVEEMGGSCDGIVTHPQRYWDMVRSGLLTRLGEVGVRVSRTRMVRPDQLLFGDFRAAVTLLEPGRSTLALRDGVIEATVRLGLAVHLPQHLLLVETA
ncbi:family 3 encapsulin nanocompartment shell protein [Micromonospora sp. MS34]|uniref:family 3 encapsulin nanocompartment shell protein n=1 Tax=Micromonospora sp. MS34 TaxID=3385971 RepID=UPI0039A266CB